MPGSSSRSKPRIEKRKLYENANGNDEFSTDAKCRKDKIYGRSDDEGEVVNVDDIKLNSKVYDDDSKYEKVENQARKSGRERNEWHAEEELRKTGLEKEQLDKRMKRRGGYSDNDIEHKDEVYTYQENGERASKSRDVKHQAGNENDNKHKNGKYRENSERDRHREDKYREDGNRDYKHKEGRYREDVDQDHRHNIRLPRDDTDRRKRSRVYSSEFENRNLKDDNYRKTNNRGGTLINDDRADMRNRRRDGKDEVTDHMTRIVKEQRSESEKRFLSSDRGWPTSRNDDKKMTANSIHHRSSPTGTFYPSRDHHRVSKQEEHNVKFNRDDKTFRSLDKITQKSDNHVNDGPGQTGMRSDMHPSAIPPSPKINEDRDLNKLDVRSNVDVKESGQRNLSSPLGFGSNMGIWSSGQTNWNKIPNWPPNSANGNYMPFHHVPPPSFNPVMQQFRPPLLPPLFGRPPVSMNHGGMPFTGHGNPIAWSNQVAIPPPLQSWELNNAVFGDGPHEYGNWDHGRTQMNRKIMESSADMEFGAQKIDQSVHEPSDDFWFAQTSQHIENEQSLPAILTETADNTPEVMEVTKVDDTLISRGYLSKLDISEDLTRPELYDQCIRMLGSHEESVSDEFDCKILFLEEGVEDDINKEASLLSAIHDSVYKKAMSLYTKQKNDAKLMEEAFKGAVHDEVKIQKHDMDPVNGHTARNKPEISDESISSSNKLNMEVDLSVKKNNKESCEPGDITHDKPETSDESTSSSNKIGMEVEQPVPKNDKESCEPFVGECEVKPKHSFDDYNGSKELDISSGDGSFLVLKNVSSNELIELGSVDRSQIHQHSAESTH
uniref:uncharacterized protein LOC122580288 n=1 Tax=Erigeron canadensis TaxID=72917 RepID=UPI001CB94BF4|nr:uncharacterized protein LOC122580288 [Erigeron canadensis]